MINRNSCGGIRTGKSEVKFLDFSTTNDCESIYQVCFHWSRTKVQGSKMIRYHRSLYHKRCRLGICIFKLFNVWYKHRMRNQSLWVPGKSDRSHVVLWAKELVECFVFLRPLGLRLRKLGDRRRSDTVVVSTINYADSGLVIVVL